MGEEYCSSVLNGLCVGSTYFEHKKLHKYTRVAWSQDGVEVKSMIDLVLVKKDMLSFVEDMTAVRDGKRHIRLPY